MISFLLLFYFECRILVNFEFWDIVIVGIFKVVGRPTHVCRGTVDRGGVGSPSVNTNTHTHGLSFEGCSSKHDYWFAFSCNAYENKKSFRDERNNNFKSA